MNLMLLSSADFTAAGTAQIDDYRAQHLIKVHNSRVGDTVRVGVLNGTLGTAKITDIDGNSVCLSLNQCDTPPPAPTPVTIVMALPRPQMLKRSLQTLATMGVKQIYLIASARVEKSFWSSPSLADQEIRHHLTLGLEQGIDSVMPQVHLRTRFKPFVEDELPDLCQGIQAWLAHPGDYPPCPRQAQGQQLLVIGPEGGFLDYEVEKFIAAGCQAIQLGPRILRVETALPVLLSRLYPH